MKKQLFTLSSLLIGMAFSSMVYANPTTSTYDANTGLETITMNNMSSSEYGAFNIIDHNPTSYTKTEVTGHQIESWVKDNTAFTSIDGNINKQHKIQNGLEKTTVSIPNSGNHSQYSYTTNVVTSTEKNINNNTIKSWIDDNTAFTSVNGNIVKSTALNTGANNNKLSLSGSND